MRDNHPLALFLACGTTALLAMPGAAADDSTGVPTTIVLHGPIFETVGELVGEAEATYDWVRGLPPNPNTNITDSYFCIYTETLAPRDLPVQQIPGGMAVGIPLEATLNGNPLGGGNAQFVAVSRTGDAPCDSS